MSLTTTFNTALSGLSHASRSAQTVAANLAGSQTDGYGVRRLATVAGGGQTTVRDVDPVLLGDRRLADGGQGYHAATASALTDLEDLFGVPGTSGGVLDRINRLDAALTSAAAAPQSDLRLGQAVSALENLTETLNSASDRIQQMRTRSDSDIAAQVQSLNRELGRVETLNADIARAKILGGDVASLMDQRQATVDRIARIVPVRELPRDNDKIALLTTGGGLLLDGKAAEIEFSPTHFLTADLSLQGSTLSPLTVNGRNSAISSDGGKLAGGTLAAAFVIRDELAPAAQDRLDLIASDLLSRFQGPGVDPTQTATTPGLLTDRGSAAPVPDTLGLAERISVNPVIQPSAGGTASLLRDGLGAVAPGPIGEAAQLNRWRSALTAPSVTAFGPRDAAGLAATLIAQLGTDRSAAQSDLSHANARADTLRQSELAKGVDTDSELQRLLVIEQAYAANARVIETAGLLIQRLMEI